MAAITGYLETILQGKDLSFEQAKELLDIIFAGEVPDVQVAAVLTAMRMKKESAVELAGLARSLRDHAVKVDVRLDCLIDTCGTGGAGLKTFNISTAAALVAAGAGAYVAKHGNRAITSICGSADVLAELGVNINSQPDTVAKCIRQGHIGFMFAPNYHPAMKYVQPIRKSLPFRTVFNILGPLANPADASAQVIGVPQRELMPTIAEALKILGVKRAMVVDSEGLDEISNVGKTKILELKDGRVTAFELDPADYRIKLVELSRISGGDTKANAKIIKDIMEGAETGPRKDVVMLNAAAAIMVAGLADDFAAALELAEESIKSGKAARCLGELVRISNG